MSQFSFVIRMLWEIVKAEFAKRKLRKQLRESLAKSKSHRTAVLENDGSTTYYSTEAEQRAGWAAVFNLPERPSVPPPPPPPSFSQLPPLIGGHGIVTERRIQSGPGDLYFQENLVIRGKPGQPCPCGCGETL